MEDDVWDVSTVSLPARHPALDPWDRPLGLPPSTARLVQRLISEGAWGDLETIFALQEQQIPPGRSLDRWTCTNTFCRDPSRWWISIHGVIHCSNCTAPSLPGLIALQGLAETAPFLDLVTGKPLLDTEFRGNGT